MRRDPGFTVAELIVVIAIMALMTTLLVPALARATEKANEPRYSQNLYRTALGAMQYADEKGVFPHKASIEKLDGGFSSDTAARCMRVLTQYVEDPERFVCPGSPDSRSV